MRKINKNFARRLASWFMVVAMMVTLVGCGKDVPSTPDTTPTTPVVKEDVDTNVDVDTDTNVDTNVDVEVETEPVVEPAKVIYEGLTPAGTGYGILATASEGLTMCGLSTYFVPIDKNEHTAFIVYVGDLIEDGGDYYAAKKSSFDEDADINLYTYSIENCKYAVYFEAPSDFIPNLSRINDEAINGHDIRAYDGSLNDANEITIKAFPMEVANNSLEEYALYTTLKDHYVEKGYEDVQEYSFEREDEKVTAILSVVYGDNRIFFANFVSLDEAKLVNEYSITLNVSLDFPEEEALEILNSVKIMEKDEADELYMSLLRQTEANEYFDPATIE